MKKAAVIGLGDIAPNHLNAINKNTEISLAAVCDIDVSRARTVPGVPFYTDYFEMIAREKPDCVHICLPHYLHYPIAKEAAALGCDIFAEKPLAINTGEALEYCKLEKQYGIHICICFQNRLNPTTEALVKELRSGEHGRITGIRGDVAWYRSKDYYDAKPWRARMSTAGGGCMINQSIHTMDLMQYIANEPVDSIRGSISQLLDYPGVEVEDTAAANITFQSGMRGYFSATVANYSNLSVSIYVQCEKTSFRIDNGKLYRTDTLKPVLLAEDSVPETGKAYYGDSHSKLIDRFYQFLETGTGSYITPFDALTSIRMIDAVRESSAAGKAVRFSPYNTQVLTGPNHIF